MLMYTIYYVLDRQLKTHAKEAPTFQICQRNGNQFELLLGDAGVENPDMQHSSLGLCLQILIRNGSTPLSTCKLYYSLLFSADIFLIVYMIPCMGSTQVHELAPYVRFIIYRDTQHFCYFARVFCLNSGAKCEFLCKMSSAP